MPRRLICGPNTAAGVKIPTRYGEASRALRISKSPRAVHDRRLCFRASQADPGPVPGAARSRGAVFCYDRADRNRSGKARGVAARPAGRARRSGGGQGYRRPPGFCAIKGAFLSRLDGWRSCALPRAPNATSWKSAISLPGTVAPMRRSSSHEADRAFRRRRQRALPAPNRRILGARMRRLATLLTLILVVAACRASAAEHKLFAWRVAGDPGTVYLLGSIHVGKPDLYPLAQPIEQAFAGSAELVEEIDMSGANLALLQQQILQRGLYTGGDKLENHLSPTTRAALAAYLQRNGQAPTALSAMRPWLADMQILTAQLQALG